MPTVPTSIVRQDQFRSRTILYSNRGAACERGLFPSKAFIETFIQQVVSPIPRRQFRPITNPPHPDSTAWASPLRTVEERTASAAFDLVCSSYSATFAEVDMDGGRFLTFSVPVAESIAGINRRALFAPVLRFLPLVVQQSYAIVNDGGDRADRATQERLGSIVLYNVRRTLRILVARENSGNDNDDNKNLVFRSIYGHECIPMLARTSADHPIVGVIRRNNFLSFQLRALASEAPLVQNVRGRTLDHDLPSFCFPLNFGAADSIDMDLDDTLPTVRARWEEQGTLATDVLPVAGFPPEFREVLISAADELATTAREIRETGRAPSNETAAWLGLGAWALFGPAAGIFMALAVRLVAGRAINRMVELFESIESGLRAAAAQDPGTGRLGPNTWAMTAIAILAATAEAVSDEVVDFPIVEFATRLRPPTSFGDALLAAFRIEAPYPPTEWILIPGAAPDIPPQARSPNIRGQGVPIIHLSPKRLNFPFDNYQELARESVFERFLSPSLQFRNTLDLAMDMYQQAMNSESIWHALSPLIQSPGMIPTELSAAADPLAQNLAATRQIFGSVPIVRVVAFIWRQVLVDNFIAWHRRLVEGARRSPKADLHGEVFETSSGVCDEEMLWEEVFCWMAEPHDRDILDRVLGPVTRRRPNPELHPDDLWTRDWIAGLFVRVFRSVAIDPSEHALARGLQRLNELSEEDRNETWPRFLEIVAGDWPCGPADQGLFTDTHRSAEIDPRDTENPRDQEFPDWWPSGERSPTSSLWTEDDESGFFWRSSESPRLTPAPAPRWR